MFDWIPDLFLSISATFWLGYAFGIAVGFLSGILFWMHRVSVQEARQLAKDIEARQAECPDEIEVEARWNEYIKEVHDEIEAGQAKETWVRLLESCNVKKGLETL